jgi:hypothetical protein
MSVTIKSGSYCPICRGITMCDCKHPAHLFHHSYFEQYINAKEANDKLRASLMHEQIENRNLSEALETMIEYAASYFNICPDRSGKQIAKLEEARAVLAKVLGEEKSS